MAHKNKYAKFSTGQKVILSKDGKEVETKVEQFYLDEVNDAWLYRLADVSGWYTKEEIREAEGV